MADYAKKTNAELQEILKSRGLATSGKKAELIARLTENDEEAAAAQEAPAAEPESESTPAAETTQPAAPATTEPTPAQPTSSSTEQPTDPTSTAVAEHPSPDTTLANQTNYSLNLPTSQLDNELAKRKARAERFGTGTTVNQPATADSATPATSEPTEPAADAEALRNLERAKRFGTGQTAIGKLDEALPTEGARGSRKRGHAAVTEGAEMDDPGLKRSFMNRGRGGGGRGGGGRFSARNRGGPGGGGKPTTTAAAAAKPTGISKGAPAYTSEKDKLAAEARKKKFATA